MGIDLYTLRKRAVMLLAQDQTRQTIYFLQIAVEHALLQDSQKMVDSAVRYAKKEWADQCDLPDFVVRVGSNGFPQPGSPIFRWPFFKRSYCFDHELPAPFGFLGNREISGYQFRTVQEQVRIDTFDPARRIDAGSTKVYKDFWQGELFESGEEFLYSQRQVGQFPDRNGRTEAGSCHAVPPRISKILSLIRFIKEKGRKASPADLSLLGSLKQKAVQLGYSC